MFQVWLPSPSWANHNAIFSSVGMEVGAYAYYDKATCGFDFEGAKADIKVSMKENGVHLRIISGQPKQIFCRNNKTEIKPLEKTEIWLKPDFLQN